MSKKLEQIKTQSHQIAANTDMSEKEKSESIDKLYKRQLSRMKPKKKVVIVRRTFQNNSKHVPKVKGTRVKVISRCVACFKPFKS